MEFEAGIFSLTTLVKVVLIDLLLSGDNAVVIAMACRSLPARTAKKAVLYGTVAAVALRLVFAAAVSWLLAAPFLKLIAGAALLVIAVKLTVQGKEEPGQEASKEPGPAVAGPASGADAQKSLWGAIIAIIVADAAMSLDNVLALVAAARGSFFFLALGLALSVPLLMFGSLFVAGLLKRYPLLILAGGALLGWLAGDIAATDAAIAGWVASHAPALVWGLPVLGVVVVLVTSWVMRRKGARPPASGCGLSRPRIPAQPQGKSGQEK